MSAKKKTSRSASKEAGAEEKLRKTADTEEKQDDDGSVKVRVLDGQDAQADDGGESSTQEPPESDVERLTREKNEQHDRLLRAQAEFDNYRKRMQKERADILKYGAENALREILPVIDNIDLAVESARSHGDSDAKLLEGIEMIRSQFVSVLEKMGVKPVESVDHQFDPNKHDALLRVPAPESDDGKVVGEIRKGYYLHDKVLRPAQVTVGTHEDAQAAKDGAENSES